MRAQLKQRCKKVAPGKAPSVEGLGSNAYENSEWLVVDAGSVVAHVFEEDARREYDIEGLWAGSTEGESLEAA
jgi:ribosomal silencing factor RsfS